MKPVKLLAALMPVIAIASEESAGVSTVTVTNPVSTHTHTNIVFVTASAGPIVNTSFVSLSASDNPSVGELSTIRLTSYTTSTTTEVVTPPDATTTIVPVTAANVSISCAMRPPSTITVTVTGTSIPVITESVYPIPASNIANNTETQTPPYQNVSASVTTSKVVPSPPYLNTSVVYTMTYTSTFTMTSAVNTTTEILPIESRILGVPDPVRVTPTASSSSFPGSATNGSFFTSNAMSVRPPRIFSLFTSILSFSELVKAQSYPTSTPENGEAEALSDTCLLREFAMEGCQDIPQISKDLKSLFYPYPAPLNSGPPPHLTKSIRDVPTNNTVTTEYVSSIIVKTSTVLYTETQVTPISVTPTLSPASLTGSVSPTSIVSSTSVVSAVVAPNITSLTSGMSSAVTTELASTVIAPPPIDSNITSPLLVPQANVTTPLNNITVPVTVTQPPVSTFISTTMTLTSSVTYQEHTTSTKTVSQTFASFTGDVAPTAQSAATRLGFSIDCVILMIWFMLTL